MPILNLIDVDADNQLCPTACIDVLAVMCFPRSSRLRQRFKEGLLGAGANSPNSHSPDPVRVQLKEYAQRGALAGEIFMTLLQLHEAGERPSIENVIKIMRRSRHDRDDIAWWPVPEEWRASAKLRTHRDTVFRCFAEFESVRHLWASLTSDLAHSSGPLPIENNERLLVFLASACQLANTAKRVPLYVRRRPSGPRRPCLVEPRSIWRFITPDPSPKQSDSQRRPLSDQALAYLREI